MKLACAPLLLASLAAGFGGPAAAQDLVGVASNGDFYEMNSMTGSGTLIGPSGFTNLDALATAGCVTYSVSGSTLISIDLATGAGTALGTIPLVAVRAMALSHKDGLLYAVEDGGGPLSRDVLYTIDPATRSVHKVGSMGYTGIVGLAFTANELLAWDTGTGMGAGLVRVDLSTGTGTDVNPAVGGSAATEQFLAYHAFSNGLLTGRDELFRVSTTGVTTLVGSGGYSDLRGVEQVGVGTVIGYCFQQKLSTCGTPVGQILQTGQNVFGFGGTGAYFGSHGVVLYTPNGPAQIPFEGGELCINPLGRRESHVIRATGGSPTDPCGARFFIDILAFSAGQLGGNPAPFLQTPGQRVHMQFWSHDVQPALSYLSPAIGYNVCP